MRKKLVVFLWSMIAAGVLFVAVMFVLIWNGVIGYMPEMEDLQNPIDRYATQIYSADGKVIGTWNKSKQNRIRVDFKDINPYVIEALVATEDDRFYEHSGVDFYALSRAIVKRGILGQTSAGGGSTITQQLAKMLWTGAPASNTFERILQKPVEWVIAIKLERNFTKEEIITMYLNQFDFLHNAVGIKNASNTYFSKNPDQLTLEEAAMFIGMCKNPSYFNPVRYEERCTSRRNVVMKQMVKAGYITQAEYEEAAAKPIELKFHRADHKEGVAPYVREFLRKYMMMEKPERNDYPEWNYAQYYHDSLAYATDPLCGWCNKNKKADGSNYDIYTDGLKVYTTIDTRMQQYAEEAVNQHVVKYLQPAFNKECKYKKHAPYSNILSEKEIKQSVQRSMMQSERWIMMKKANYAEEEIRASFNEKTEMTIYTPRGEVDTTMTPMDSLLYYKKFLRAGFCSIDAKTGAVKALVGGINFAHFQYNMAVEGRRQVGSTIKPYVYSLAMENGMSPCDVVENYSPYPGWSVKGGSGGSYTLRSALQLSLNGVSTQLMYRWSRDGKVFWEKLRMFGIHLPGVAPTPTMCLGSCEISVLDMVSAYTAFANHGLRCAPMFVTRIEDSNGHVIAKFEPRMNEAISEEAANKMLILLKGVVDGGTGGRLRYQHNITAQMGGKTGTTNNNSDGWFMGVTPELVSGCWVGGEDRAIHFDNMSYGQGASAALPVVGIFLNKLFRDKSLPYRESAVFDIPAGFDGCEHDDEVEVSDMEEVFE